MKIPDAIAWSGANRTRVSPLLGHCRAHVKSMRHTLPNRNLTEAC